MGTTPAAELARIRREKPLWSIRQLEGGQGFTAHRGTGRYVRALYAPTLATLELKLREKGGSEEE